MSTLRKQIGRNHEDFMTYSRNCANAVRQEAFRTDPQKHQKHLGQSAGRLLNITEHATAIDSSEKHKRAEFYSLYGSYTSWIAATNLKQSAETKGIDITREQKQLTTEVYSRFNDSLREVFNRYGKSTTPAEVMQALDTLVPISRSDYHRREMSRTITGVRTEMLSELALATMGLETRRAEPEEDRRGIDYFVTIGDREVALDIKTSPRGEEKANQRNFRYGDETIAICPFSRRTLNEIPTILPADPYGQMLEPAQEMLGRMFRLETITDAEYREIKEDLDRQLQEAYV